MILINFFFGLDVTKPAIIGEFPAAGMTSKTNGFKEMNEDDCYINTYKNACNGIMAWRSNADGNLDSFIKDANEVTKLMSE